MRNECDLERVGNAMQFSTGDAGGHGTGRLVFPSSSRDRCHCSSTRNLFPSLQLQVFPAIPADLSEESTVLFFCKY